ncbi:MAG: WXG100 family type VII secretion target [Clostridia bacterium]|nr:WXG100 family type VII secretion target [Clostridia bacterium]
MAELKVTPEELMSYGNQIAEKAEQLNAKVSALDAKIESIASAWTGISSNAFYNSYVNLQPTLHSFAQVLQQIAQVAQTSAKTYDDVDVQLASNFS